MEYNPNIYDNTMGRSKKRPRTNVQVPNAMIAETLPTPKSPSFHELVPNSVCNIFEYNQPAMIHPTPLASPVDSPWTNRLMNTKTRTSCARTNRSDPITSVVDEHGTVHYKPALSYAQLICRAIYSSANRRMTLSNIYAWIMSNYEFYNLSENGWQNSVRHNLSTNKCFIKQARPKEIEGKGSFWTVDPQVIPQLMESETKRPRPPNSKKAKTRCSTRTRSPCVISANYTVVPTSCNTVYSPQLMQPPASSFDTFQVANDPINADYTRFDNTLADMEMNQLIMSYLQYNESPLTSFNVPLETTAHIFGLSVCANEQDILPSTVWNSEESETEEEKFLNCKDFEFNSPPSTILPSPASSTIEDTFPRHDVSKSCALEGISRDVINLDEICWGINFATVQPLLDTFT